MAFSDGFQAKTGARQWEGKMRDLTYYVACSLDGFIARSNGSFDFFLMEGDHLEDIVESFPETIPTHSRKALGVSGGNRVFDTVLMGRGDW
jgi:hypothetical protein